MPVSGFYFLTANIGQASGSGAILVARLLKNGSTIIATGTFFTPATANNSGSVDGLFQLTAGDYVEVTWAGNAGATGSTGANTHFDGFLVSAA